MTICITNGWQTLLQNVLLSLLVPEKSPLARQYFTFSVLLTTATSTSHHKFELNNAMNVK